MGWIFEKKYLTFRNMENKHAMICNISVPMIKVGLERCKALR